MSFSKSMVDAFVGGKKEITVQYKGKDVKFYANELGYLTTQNIALQANTNGKNGLAMLVAESITDADGNKFTYDEIVNLKKEYAEVFFAAVSEMFGKEGAEKN